MAKFIGKIEIRNTKNELRPLSVLKKLEKEYNSETQIKLDFGKYIPLRVLNLEYEKLGLTEEKVRRCLFHDIRNAPLDLLEENYTKTSIVEEKVAREYLEKLIKAIEKRKENKRRNITRKAIKQEIKENILQAMNTIQNENQ